jgi:hypothetical protein
MVSLIKVIHFKNMPDSEQEKKNFNDYLTMACNQLTPRLNQATQNCNIYRGTQAVPMSWCNDGQVQPWLDMLHNDGNDSHSKFLDEIFQEMSSDVNDLTRLASQYGFKL